MTLDFKKKNSIEVIKELHSAERREKLSESNIYIILQCFISPAEAYNLKLTCAGFTKRGLSSSKWFINTSQTSIQWIFIIYCWVRVH